MCLQICADLFLFLTVFYATALTTARSDGSTFFPFFPSRSFPLYPSAPYLYLNTNGGLLKRNCPQNAGVPVVFHTQGACRTSRTRVESVCRELLVPVPRFQGYRLLLV